MNSLIEKSVCLEIDLILAELQNKIKCVYFLLFEGEIVYTGMTKNLLSRILGHLKERTKVFDSVQYIETDSDQLEDTEKNYIEILHPKYNKSGLLTKYPLKHKKIEPLALQHICSKCGNSFYGASHARYCSDACKAKAYREREKRKPETTDTTGARICTYCGTAFTGALYGRYCSNAHKQAAYRQRKKRTA